MTKTQWSYLQNPFDNVTKRNFKKMYLMATDHFDKLKQSAPYTPVVNELLEFGLPYFNRFIDQYRKKETDTATYRMATAQLENLMSELSGTHIRKWDVTIQIEYDVVDPIYKSLLPNGRRPFQTGAYDLRIDQVFSLADKLSALPQFNELRDKVRDVGSQLLQARTAQQGADFTDGSNSTDLETRRYELAVAMHYIFAGLMKIYYLNLPMVEQYYDLRYFRQADKSDDDNPVVKETINLTLPPNSKNTTLEGRLTEGDTIKVTNNGTTTFLVYAAENPTQEPSGLIAIIAGQFITLTAGATDNLIVLWNETSNEGSAIVELF